MKRKEAVYKGLEFIDVYFQDNTATSPDYFQITEFPAKLTAGKNLFKLRGHPTNLKVGGVLNFEVLDYNGNPIYSEVINYIDEDKSRVIAIYIYEDTSPGDCTVTILAEAAVINGFPVPTEWQGRANVKWTRSAPVNPNISNVSEIIFEQTPTVTVDELIGVQLDRAYPNNIQFPTYSTGTVKYFSFNGKPAIEIQGGTFSSDMANGTITIAAPNNPIPLPNYAISTTPYVSTIKKILNPTVALLDTEYTALSSQSISVHTYNEFDYSAFSLAYEQTPTYVETQNSQSFAYIQVAGLEPAAGDVSRIKVFTNNNGTVGTWELINDIELEETEIFPPSTASMYPDKSIGIFTTQSIINTYWEGISYNGAQTLAPATLTWTTASIENGMRITSSSLNLDADNQILIAQIKSNYAGVFLASSSYKVSLDAIGTQTTTTQAKLSIYLSGSSFYQDPTDYFNQTFPKKLGKRLGEITVTGTTQRFDDQVFSFESNYNGTGVLLLVVESGDWIVSDIHVTSDNDAGYTPNYTRIKSLVNTTHKLDNQISFKVEYYNVNGEKSKQISYVNNKDWEGGNRYIDGNYSMLTGSLYVADSLESGIGISGYPNSGFVRSLGYEGFDAGFAGFLLWSGSALPGQTSKGQLYSGVGLELYANTASYFRYSTADSEIDVRTDKFFFGNPSSSYISGSNGLIQISSSNFLLSSSGNLYANDGIFSGTALANIITNKMITITAANSSSYLQTYNLPGTSPTQTSYRIRLDGALGGELGVYIRITCQLLYPIGPVILPSNPIGGAGQSTFTILNDTSSNQLYNLFIDKSLPSPSIYDIIDITDGAVLNFVKVSGNNYSLGGTETPTPYTFRRNLDIGDGDVTGGQITIRKDSNLTGTNKLDYIKLLNSSSVYGSLGESYVLSIAGNTSTTTALGLNDPYMGIFKGTANATEPFIAFSGSSDGNTRRTMINAGVNYPYTEISSNYSASINDYFITATNTSGTTIVSLPTGSRGETGRVLEFKYRQTGGTFEIDAAGTDTIDGVTSKTTTQINSAMKLVCNGLGRWNVMFTTGSWT
jgi:hypothetical protein